MTNKEKYMKEICDIATIGESLAVDKMTLAPCACSRIECSNCIASEGHCRSALVGWANSEYVEPSPFKKDELVEVSDDGIQWRLRYFSHQENGRFYCYDNGYTSQETGVIFEWAYCQKYGTLGGLVKKEK